MGSTGSAAILLCCICVVALLPMVVFGSVAPDETPKSAVPKETSTAVPEETLKSAAAEETAKATVLEKTLTTVPKETPKSVEETPKSAVPEETLKSVAPKETPKFISVGALECAGNITKTKSARKLIVDQGNGVCPVRFDHTRGISAIAGSCKDRPFPSAARCCGALKTYACPYSELINDNANGCANDMFYVIMVRGRLRPGLFSQLCVEGPLGLQC